MDATSQRSGGFMTGYKSVNTIEDELPPKNKDFFHQDYKFNLLYVIFLQTHSRYLGETKHSNR